MKVNLTDNKNNSADSIHFDVTNQKQSNMVDNSLWQRTQSVILCLPVFSDSRFLSLEGKQIFAAVYLVESIYPPAFLWGATQWPVGEPDNTGASFRSAHNLGLFCRAKMLCHHKKI